VSRGLAVVTGASSGLGRAYAESLAARGHPLLVVARREDRLRELAAWARDRHGVGTVVVTADLNAGFGSRGRLWELDPAREAEMVRLNCVAVVDLGARVLPAMVAARRGALVVVSSAAAWQPVPFMATYAATKAFELHWTEALAEELRGTGVRAVAVCPGPTTTEFTLSGGGGSTYPGIPFDDPEMVVRATWRALASGRRRAPTGVVARGSMLASRVLPRGLVLRAAAATHRERRRR
jgi:uncharacterized protein